MPTQITCKIKDGNVWLEKPDKETVQAIYNCLSVIVPNREHIPLYKRGQWDGVKRFFNWQYKYFKVGLIPYVERTLQVQFNTLQNDRCQDILQYLPFKLWVEQEKAWMEPRDFQITTVQEMLKQRGGIAALATNAGKTGCIVGLIKALVEAGKSVAVTEMTKDLLDQVKAEIDICLGMKIGRVTADIKNIRPVTIMMVPTTTQAVKRADLGEMKFMDEEIVNFISSVDAFIIDECHHSGADSYRQIFNINPSAMRFGFSGTVPPDTITDRAGITLPNIDGLEIRELLGEVVCTVKNQELIDRGISARPIINMVEYTDDVEEAAKAYGASIRKSCFQYDGYRMAFNIPLYTNKMRTFVMEHAVRENPDQWALIKKLVDRHEGMSTVIVVDWIDFGEKLAEHLGAAVYNSQTKDSAQVVTDFKAGKITKVVATSKLDEGLSIDRIKVLILATTGSSTRQFLQRIGRGLRRKMEDNTLLVYDFLRFGHKYLIEPSRKRIALWQGEGFEINFVEDL